MADCREENKNQTTKQPDITSSTGARPKTTGARPKTTGARPRTDGVLPKGSTNACPETNTDSRQRQSQKLEAISKKLQKKAQQMEKQSICDLEYITGVIKLCTGNNAHLSNKYKQIYNDVRKLEVDQVRYSQLQIEHEKLRRELTKMSLACSRLANLCRTLQMQNKEIKENVNKERLGEEKKPKEVSGAFQKRFDELSKMMEASNREIYKLQEDNVIITKNIQFFSEKCTETEEQLALIKREAKLQKKHYASDLAKVKLQEKTEQEQRERDRKILEMDLKKSEEMCTQLQENLKVLQEQNKFYAKKCEEYENATKKSQEMLQNYQPVETEKISALGSGAEFAMLVNDLKDLEINTTEVAVKDSRSTTIESGKVSATKTTNARRNKKKAE